MMMSFVWQHGDGDSDYWKGLSGMHSLIRYGVYVELILSSSIIGILFYYYQATFKVKLKPLDFNYNLNNNDEIMKF